MKLCPVFLQQKHLQVPLNNISIVFQFFFKWNLRNFFSLPDLFLT